MHHWAIQPGWLDRRVLFAGDSGRKGRMANGSVALDTGVHSAMTPQGASSPGVLTSRSGIYLSLSSGGRLASAGTVAMVFNNASSVRTAAVCAISPTTAQPPSCASTRSALHARHRLSTCLHRPPQRARAVGQACPKCFRTRPDPPGLAIARWRVALPMAFPLLRSTIIDPARVGSCRFWE